MNCYMPLLLFFGYIINSCSHLPLHTYHYVNVNMNWTNAQQYCRVNYNDLATFESMNDVSLLKPDFSYSLAWNRLRGTSVNDTSCWTWSTLVPMERNYYYSWFNGELNSRFGDDNCVIMETHGEWSVVSCSSLNKFVCYNVTNQNETTYVLISTLTTWNSAQAYCRRYYKDLARIENSAQNDAVFHAQGNNNTVWIGLYRVPWIWSDKSPSTFRNWQKGKPYNNGGNEYYAAENPQHQWSDYDCTLEYPFICYQVLKVKTTTVRMQIETNVDIRDPAFNNQILQQVGAVLTSLGRADFSLQWNIQPRKQENKLKICLLDFI